MSHVFRNDRKKSNCKSEGRPGGRPSEVWKDFAVFLYWFSRFQLMRSPSVVEELEDEELDWFFDFDSL